jgi:hypothetical protein
MNNQVPPKKDAQAPDGDAQGPNKALTSQAQRRRDRQQAGVAESLAADAELLFPALDHGVLLPERLVEQARYVLEKAKLHTERHREGEISEAHVGHILATVGVFARALDEVGVKVLGWRRVKQSHYLDVMRLWEKKNSGAACRVGWRLSHLRRLLVPIGRPDVIPRYDVNIELLRRHGIMWEGARAFVSKTYFDWESSGIDPEVIFQAMPDPCKRAAAKLMYFLGMSELEAVTWQVVDPRACSFARVEATDERRDGRDVEFSADPGFRAKQVAAWTDAWNCCGQHAGATICPPDVSPAVYAERLRNSIRSALKRFPDQKIKPMQLRDGFCCQVFRDHAGMSLQEAKARPRVAQDDWRFDEAVREAECQLGVQAAKAPRGHLGMPFSWSQSKSVARSLRAISVEFATLGIGKAWVGDGEASAGKCLFVQLIEGAQPAAVLRLHQMVEESILVNLRVVPVSGAADVPEGAAPVMARSAHF